MLTLLTLSGVFFLAEQARAQTVLTVNEVRIISTSGMVAAKSADGKSVTITVTAAPGKESPVEATQRAGTSLSTDATGSAVIVMPAAGTFRMGPDTEVRLPPDGEKSHSLEHLKGQLFLEVDAAAVKKAGGSFRLKTPAALLAVKGTQFFVINAGGFDTVGVNTGEIVVSEPGSRQTVPLVTGNAVPVKAGQMGNVRPLTNEEKAFRKHYGLAAGFSGFTNSLGMKFVAVPGTKVMMCIHETRILDYSLYPNLEGAMGWKKPLVVANVNFNSEQMVDQPVRYVDWPQANGFCEWLSKKEGRKYRLPTDREWSCAVGIAEQEDEELAPWRLDKKVKGHFPWGKAWPPPAKSGNFCDMSRKATFPPEYYAKSPPISGYDDGFPDVSPVMRFKPNDLGIYDLEGNVNEWCADWYDAARTQRFSRGGSCLSSTEESLLSSCRLREKEDKFGDSSADGFRVVIELE